jgi:hypothetical protein
MSTGRLLAMDTPSALKANALPGLAWDVVIDSPEEVADEPLLPALGILEKTPGVLRAGLAGDHLRAITQPDLRDDDLLRALGALGWNDIQISQTEPTLEDVFLALANSN